jgi:hypothetical protein
MANKEGPVVGMGATECVGSDSNPYTVIAVNASGKTITLQADKYTRTDSNGLSECQEYTYERDPQGNIEVATLRKNGRYVAKGSSQRGLYYHLGSRRRYRDPSF